MKHYYSYCKRWNFYAIVWKLIFSQVCCFVILVRVTWIKLCLYKCHCTACTWVNILNFQTKMSKIKQRSYTTISIWTEIYYNNLFGKMWEKCMKQIPKIVKKTLDIYFLVFNYTRLTNYITNKRNIWKSIDLKWLMFLDPLTPVLRFFLRDTFSDLLQTYTRQTELTD